MFISKLTDLKLIISILFCSCMFLIFDNLHHSDIYLFFYYWWYRITDVSKFVDDLHHIWQFASYLTVCIIVSKFVDDLPLKADLGASLSLLDTGSWCCRLIIDESLIHVCNGWPYMYVLVNVWTWSWMNLFVWETCTMMLLLY